MSYKGQLNVISFNKFDYKLPNLYILIGIPCSGKTYYAKKYLKAQNTIIVSTDEIRKEHFGTKQFNKESNNYILSIAKLRIEEQLRIKNNVVLDATNTNKKHRKAIINLGK